MAIVRKLAENQTIENVTIYEWQDDTTNAVVARELYANEGYAMYDTSKITGIDPETGEPLPPRYFYSTLITPTTPLTNYVAVPYDPSMDVVGVPEKPETEVMKLK